MPVERYADYNFKKIAFLDIRLARAKADGGKMKQIFSCCFPLLLATVVIRMKS